VRFVKGAEYGLILGVLLFATQSLALAGTCTGAYPSYFQDPAFGRAEVWGNQRVINQPAPGWKGPVFRLSDAYGRARPEPESAYNWLRFNPFREGLNSEEKQSQARAYSMAVMHYAQQGNTASGDINADWNLCQNKVRAWFHMPYQTYDTLSGREFVHGLTREAQVTASPNKGKPAPKAATVWAVTFYNPAAAHSLNTAWPESLDSMLSGAHVRFEHGSVIGKLLFTTTTPAQSPQLSNMPAWQANISAPGFCTCTTATGEGSCTYKEEAEQCPRSVGKVYLMQFDVAVRDDRSPGGWAYASFIADGQRKASEKNPWLRVSPLGLMWGGDSLPAGMREAGSLLDPRADGFRDGVVFRDEDEKLNLASAEQDHFDIHRLFAAIGYQPGPEPMWSVGVKSRQLK